MSFKSVNIYKLKPELFFVVFASFFGLIILFITPPFQVPDEINHFYRAYQISEGELISIKQDNRLGGYLPASLLKIVEPFDDLIGRMHTKTNCKTIIEQSKIPLKPEERVFADFPNTGIYSFVSYLPQSVSIFIFRKLSLPPLYIFYGARLFTFFIWILCIFYSIKIIHFYKWLFALIALLPMSLFINMSLSADVVTNLLAFFLIAYILRLTYTEKAFSVRDTLVLLVLAILLASAKLVYSPLLLLFLIIPKGKFGNSRNYYVQLALLATITAGTCMFWAKAMHNLYIPYGMYNVQFRDLVTIVKCADMQEQTQYILNHGFYVLHVFVNSMIRTFDMYYQGYIGTFGWLDTKLPVWFINLSYAVLALIAFIDKNIHIKVKLYHKLIILAGLTIVLSLILLSQHLTWDCVGGDVIATLQGRYFIPVFPLLFILLYNTRVSFPKIIVPLVVVFSFFSLSFTVITLYERYYVESVFDSVSIKCDAEVITKDNVYVTNLPSVFLENAHTQSNEMARSGTYSAKLTPVNQFAFTYRLYDCGLGDIINIDVWRHGTNGVIIISGDNNNIYTGRSDPVEKDSLGWEHLQLNYTLPKNMKGRELGMCLFYDGKDSSYFDDISISYHKFR